MAPIEDFEAIAMGHLPAIYRAAVAICGRNGVADDMVQTTLLKAYERFDSFEAGTNCKAWLLCILRNSWGGLPASLPEATGKTGALGGRYCGGSGR